jgi:hypothetical protein
MYESCIDELKTINDNNNFSMLFVKLFVNSKRKATHMIFYRALDATINCFNYHIACEMVAEV